MAAASDDLHLRVTIGSAKRRNDSAVCGLTIPNTLLLQWYEAGLRESSLIKALNHAITGNCLAVRDNSKRLSSSLERRCNYVAMRYKSAVGRRKYTMLDETTVVNVLKDETISVEDQAKIIDQCEMISLLCSGFEKEIKRLYEDIASAAHITDDTNPDLSNKGRQPIDKLSKRQTRRKLIEVTENVKQVLWFAESFGLRPVQLQCETINSHQALTLVLDKGGASSIGEATQQSLVPEDEKEKLLQVTSSYPT